MNYFIAPPKSATHEKAGLMDVWKFKSLKWQVVLGLAALLCRPVLSAEPAQKLPDAVNTAGLCQQAVQRPCVALVLGGGGARGAAHIAVLEAIEQQGLQVDMVIGTSIGAFVGGMYAQGKTPAQIREIIRNLPWDQGARDRVGRPEVSPQARHQRDAFPIQPDLGVGYKGLKLPRGVLHGQSMATLIEQAYGLVPELQSFDQLPIPFRAVATDLATGDAVVLQQGNLLHAVQASMSIPGVVRPFEWQGRLLVDGGVANNLPISVAKSLGAQRIIAVAIDAPLLKREQLEDAVAVTEQLTNFLVQKAVQQQVALLEPMDVLLKPQTEQLGTLDFERFQDAYRGGELAVQAALPRLRQLVAEQQVAQSQLAAGHDSAQLATATVTSVTAQRPSTVTLSAIDLHNQTFWSDDRLLQRLDLPLHRPLTLAQIQAGVRRIYGLDTLERVSSSLVADGDQYRLALKASDKSWGPAYLSFRLQLQDDFRNQHRYQVAGSYLLTGLSNAGGWWQADVALGTDKRLNSALEYPLGDSDFSGQLQVTQSRNVLGLETSEGLSDGELTNRELLLRAGVGWSPSDPWLVSTSLVRRDGQYLLPDPLAQQLGYSDLAYVRRGTELFAEYDSLDHAFFPSSGQQWQLRWQHLQDDAKARSGASDSTHLQWRGAWSYRQHQLAARVRYDRYRSDASTVALEQFALGGLLNLSGYPQNYLFGSEVRFAALMYRQEFSSGRFSLFRSPLYLGASLERGQVKDARLGLVSLNEQEPWLWAASLFAGWDSPVGPLYLGYGQAESDLLTDPYRLYLSLGVPF